MKLDFCVYIVQLGNSLIHLTLIGFGQIVSRLPLDIRIVWYDTYQKSAFCYNLWPTEALKGFRFLYSTLLQEFLYSWSRGVELERIYLIHDQAALDLRASHGALSWVYTVQVNLPSSHVGLSRYSRRLVVGVPLCYRIFLLQGVSLFLSSHHFFSA